MKKVASITANLLEVAIKIKKKFVKTFDHSIYRTFYIQSLEEQLASKYLVIRLFVYLITVNSLLFCGGFFMYFYLFNGTISEYVIDFALLIISFGFNLATINSLKKIVDFQNRKHQISVVSRLTECLLVFFVIASIVSVSYPDGKTTLQHYSEGVTVSRKYFLEPFNDSSYPKYSNKKYYSKKEVVTISSKDVEKITKQKNSKLKKVEREIAKIEKSLKTLKVTPSKNKAKISEFEKKKKEQLNTKEELNSDVLISTTTNYILPSTSVMQFLALLILTPIRLLFPLLNE